MTARHTVRPLSTALLGLVLAGLLAACSSVNAPTDTLTFCGTDAECPRGLYCDEGVCVPGFQLCAEFDACPTGAECRNGACVALGQPDGGDGGDGDGDDGGDQPGDTARGPELEILEPPPTGSPPVHQLDFGNVAVGVTVERTIRIRNAGDQDLRVLQLSIELGPGGQDFFVPQAVLDGLPLLVAPGAEARFEVGYRASDGITDHGVLAIVSNDPDEALVRVHLVSEFKGEAGASLSAASLDFGDVPVGTPAAPLAFELSNQGTGNAVLIVRDIRLRSQANPDFSLEVRDPDGQPAALPWLLNQGDFLEVGVGYLPTQAELDQDAVLVNTDDPVAPNREVALRGRGVVGELQAAPSPVDLGRVRLGGQAEALVTLTNAGGAPLELTLVELAGVSGDWALASSDLDLPGLPGAPHPLLPGASAALTVSFSPAAAGVQTARLRVTHTGPAAELEVALSASGFLPPALVLEPDPALLSFGDVELDAATGQRDARSLPALLRNAGGDPLRVLAIARAAGTSQDFTWNPGSFAPIPSGGEAGLTVTFSPSTAGTQTGLLLVDTDDPDISLDGVPGRAGIELAGRGTDALIFVSPAAGHDFGTVTIGDSRLQAISVRNASAYPLRVNEIRLGSGSSPAFTLLGVPALPAVIPDAAGELAFQVRYLPTAGGPATGSLEILSSDLGRPLVTLQLEGLCQGCPAGYADCDANPDCETHVLTDPQNCGGCGITCTALHGANPCVDGQCTPSCDPLWGDCDSNPRNGCETPTNTLDDCGQCRQRCDLPHASESCQTGTCTLLACTPGYHDCNPDPGCETRTDNNPNACGSCTTVCSNPHGSVSCVDSVCRPGCDPLWGNCDSNPANGCEQSLTTLTHCGACGTACGPLPHASASCATGSCLVTSCDSGWCNFNGLHGDGCEFSLDTNPACASFTGIGQVSGDEGAGRITHVGRGEKWLRMYVAETFENWDTCLYLSATLTLAPGAGTDYDLYVYCDNCTTSAGSSSQGGTAVDRVDISWDEGCFLGFPTGSDSGRDVYIQVRYYAGNVCNEWTLEVYGNTAVSTRTCSTK